MSARGFDAVILGSGVIGLSTAIELRQRGLRVAVVAKDLPEDSESSGWASPWAGCNWYPFESDPHSPSSLRERDTFHYLVQLATKRPDLCERIPFQNVWSKPKSKEEEELWFSELVKDYRPIQGAMPGGHRDGREWTAFVMNAPRYMQYLAERARSAGIPLIRTRISSLDEAYDLPEVGRVDVVINATGLGAQTLIGVEDSKVYPGRGQTVLVETPKDTKRVCVMSTEDFYSKMNDPTQGPAYIIPRPGPEPHVICGGVYIPNNYSHLPDLATAERILKDCYNLRPELAGHKKVGEGNGWRDIKIVSHNVGLRPAREGGARVEVERRKLGDRPQGRLPFSAHGREGREVVVVHAYGFGSAGYQQSIGAAYQVAKLIEDNKLIAAPPSARL